MLNRNLGLCTLLSRRPRLHLEPRAALCVVGLRDRSEWCTSLSEAPAAWTVCSVLEAFCHSRSGETPLVCTDAITDAQIVAAGAASGTGSAHKGIILMNGNHLNCCCGRLFGDGLGPRRSFFGWALTHNTGPLPLPPPLPPPPPPPPPPPQPDRLTT